MLKIAFVTNNYRPYSGGVVSSIDTFSQELIRQGNEVYIITLDFKNYQQPDYHYVHRLACPIKFMYKQKQLSLPLHAQEQLLQFLQKKQIDIIHSHHPFLLGRAALKAAKRLDCPIVFTHHTLYKEYAHNIPVPQIISKPIIEKLALNYCKHVDHIIAPSNSTFNYLAANNIKTPISVIPSGINQLFFADKKNKNYAKKLKLLTVCRFNKEKNIPFLLNVIAQLDPNLIEYTLVGYGPELNNLKQLVNALNIHHINFVLSPEKNALKDLYHQADVFLFSSQTETQGIVLAEAMASGLPVVALVGPGQNDIIVQNYNGYLIHHKAEMANAILTLAKDRDLLHTLSKNAQETALNYSIQATTTDLIALYRKLLLL